MIGLFFIVALKLAEVVSLLGNIQLSLELSKMEIELLIYDIVKDNSSTVIKKGKNYYIKNIKKHIQVTVNSNNYRVITADKIYSK